MNYHIIIHNSQTPTTQLIVNSVKMATTIYTVATAMGNSSTVTMQGSYSSFESARTAADALMSAAVTAGQTDYPDDTFDIINDATGYFSYVRRTNVYLTPVFFNQVEYTDVPMESSLQSVYEKLMIATTTLS